MFDGLKRIEKGVKTGVSRAENFLLKAFGSARAVEAQFRKIGKKLPEGEFLEFSSILKDLIGEYRPTEADKGKTLRELYGSTESSLLEDGRVQEIIRIINQAAILDDFVDRNDQNVSLFVTVLALFTSGNARNEFIASNSYEETKSAYLKLIKSIGWNISPNQRYEPKKQEGNTQDQ